MSRTARRLVLQRAFADKQLRLSEAQQKLTRRESDFEMFQEDRSEIGTSALVTAIQSGQRSWRFTGDRSTREFSLALQTRLKQHSYENAVTGALRDVLEIDGLRNTIETLTATSTAQYADFM
jgi:hypothetical protein